jgi:hypothetical protein
MNKAIEIFPFLLVLLGGFVLGSPAIMNGFPFIFPDSGDYLVFTPHLYRSPYYGLFIFFFHWNTFIWAPVFMQALVVSSLLWIMVGLHRSSQKGRCFVLLILLLTAFSSLPFFVGFIMPDIFTPVMFMVMYIIGFHRDKLSRALLIYLLLLDCVATVAHISNLTLGGGFLGVFVLLWMAERISKQERLKRFALVLLPIGLSAAAVLLYNVVIFGSWSLLPAGQSFLMAHMIECGPARSYLKDACPHESYRICAYLDQLPETADELLWSSGLFEKLGGFTGMRTESRAIVLGTISERPTDVARMVGTNFVGGLLTHEPAAEFRAAYQVPSFTSLIAGKFGQPAVEAYRDSAEMRGTIPHDLIRAVDNVVLPFLTFALVILGAVARRRGDREAFVLAVIVLCAVFGDTLLCTAISNVHDRYQARVTWLIPMAVLLLLCKRREPNTKSPS